MRHRKMETNDAYMMRCKSNEQTVIISSDKNSLYSDYLMDMNGPVATGH